MDSSVYNQKQMDFLDEQISRQTIFKNTNDCNKSNRMFENVQNIW